MTFTRLASLVLTFLWLLSAAGLLVLVIWFKAPSVVASVDQHFRQSFIEAPKDRFAEIVAAYEVSADHEQHIDDLVALLADLDGVQTVDLHASLKRVSYTLLIRTLVNTTRFDAAMYWTDQWLRFDPRDIEARLTRARLLLVNSATVAEGEFELALLRSQFPNSLSVANGRAIAFASKGQLARAFLELVPFLPGSEASMRRQIGEVLEEIEFVHTAGDTPRNLTLNFESGESLAVTIRKMPEDVFTKFERVGLVPNNGVFFKKIGNAASLHLLSFDKTRDFTLSVEVPVAAPDVLDKLLDPRFRNLLHEQLQALGEFAAIEAYDRYEASR